MRGVCEVFFHRQRRPEKKDMLLFTNCTLMLTDEEFTDFLSEINELGLKYMKAEPTADSKTRRITLISSPDILI